MLKWGLLSTARINRQLIPAIRAVERAELVAVASRDDDRAQAYALEWGIPHALGSYQAMLDDPNVDAIYIALPNSLHAEWAVRAAWAGKHVLCEKPLAISVAECDQIIAAAQAAGVVVMEAVMYLYHPLLQRVRQLVQEGAVGQVKLVRGTFSFFLDRPADVRWEPSLGGGSLWDVGIYPISFMRWLLGEPLEVFGWQTLSKSGVDESLVGLLRYENGILGTVNCSFQQAFRMRVEVSGSAGTLTSTNPFHADTESRFLLRRGEAEEILSMAGPDAYQCEVEALTAAVFDKTELLVPLSSSRANVATLAALYESARTGRPVRPGA